MIYESEVTIVGGGLAGMLTALKLSHQGVNVILIDNSIPASYGKLGGFAKFSGAKFSLPPAGMGLANVTKSKKAFEVSVHQPVSGLRG